MYFGNKTGKMEADMERVKIIFHVMEILVSTWLLYRSGRIVLKKGNTKKIVNDPYVIMIATIAAFLTITWRMAFSSWVLFYSSMVYWLIYMLFTVKWEKWERIIIFGVWLLFLMVIPFV